MGQWQTQDDSTGTLIGFCVVVGSDIVIASGSHN